ncbi:MAG TPA: DUF1289 domain-containing protein [Methyloceanibacter sp.]|nr:DUF1289 domain-containing protein [Methyloceanibacter sp.]
MIESPCIKVCILDPETQLCKGCHRTIAEIAAWPSMEDSERTALLAVLAERTRDKTN